MENKKLESDTRKASSTDQETSRRPTTTVNGKNEKYWEGTVETSDGTQEVIVFNLEKLINA